MLVVAATGHRPSKLGGYGASVHRRLIRLACRYLVKFQPDYAVCGMAQGWDQAFGWACVKVKIPFTAAVPFAGQERLWPSEDQELYRDLLRASAHVEYVGSPGYAGWKLHRRNEWIVNHCHRLCALWDGTSGGTGSCIKYAQRVAKRTGAPFIDNLWEEWAGE